MIEPDHAVQATLTEIARANNARSGLRVYEELLKLRSIGREDPESLVRQLVWYDVHKAGIGEMTTVAVLYHLSELQGHLVPALAPLMGETGDPKVEREIRELLRIIERPNAAGELDFAKYEAYIREKVKAALPFDDPFVAYLFRHAPGQTLQAFALASFDDSRRKPFLWGRHAVDDLLWKRRFGFALSNQPDAEVTKQLEALAGRDEWWARLYVAEIVRAHPELGNATLVNQLRNDSHELVRGVLKGIPAD